MRDRRDALGRVHSHNQSTRNCLSCVSQAGAQQVHRHVDARAVPEASMRAGATGRHGGSAHIPDTRRAADRAACRLRRAPLCIPDLSRPGTHRHAPDGHRRGRRDGGDR